VEAVETIDLHVRTCRGPQVAACVAVVEQLPAENSGDPGPQRTLRLRSSSQGRRAIQLISLASSSFAPEAFLIVTLRSDAGTRAVRCMVVGVVVGAAMFVVIYLLLW
jgi:hypothetical protein